MGARTKPKPSRSPQVSRERRNEAAKSALGSLPQRTAEAPGAYVSRVKTDPVQKCPNRASKEERACKSTKSSARCDQTGLQTEAVAEKKKKRADFQGVPGGVPKAPRRPGSLQLQCFWRKPSMKRALEKGCRRQRCRAGGARPGQVPSERPETSTGARIVPGRLAVNAEASRSLRFSRKT